MGSSQSSVRRSWSEICSQGEFRGRWVALGSVRYDELTAKPTEGTVVDADDDLGELCNRIQRSNRRSCAILFAEEQENERPATRPTRGRSSIF